MRTPPTDRCRVGVTLAKPHRRVGTRVRPFGGVQLLLLRFRTMKSLEHRVFSARMRLLWCILKNSRNYVFRTRRVGERIVAGKRIVAVNAVSWERRAHGFNFLRFLNRYIY